MQTVIVFRLAEQQFAFSIDHIREIVLTPAITPLPLASAHYCGVANVRGKVLAIIDLAKQFSIEQPQSADRTFTLVVAHPTHAVGFLIQEMPHTLNVQEDEIETAPYLAQDGLMQFCKSLIKHPKGLIVWLDMPKLLVQEAIAGR